MLYACLCVPTVLLMHVSSSTPCCCRRVVSGHTILQEAILLLGVQFFEIFTVVHERQEGLAQRKGNALKSRIKSVATSAGGHLPKRLRRDHRGDEPPDELEAIVAREQDMSEDDILKDHVFSCGVAFAQVCRDMLSCNAVLLLNG